MMKMLVVAAFLPLSLWSAPKHVFSMSCKVTACNRELSTPEGKRRCVDWCRANGITKLWLESYRHTERVETELLEAERDYFRSQGFAVAGMITPTQLNDAPDGQKPPMVVCWSDPVARARLRAEVVRTAKIFDTVIVDDFLFTQCGDGCKRCRADKERRGIKDWGAYRRELMYEVARDEIVNPAKAANPQGQFIVKYPCWVGNWERNGYSPTREAELFGACWVGTETRDAGKDPFQACWIVGHTQRLTGGRCGGGWYDALDCTPEKFVEQAYYTILSGAKESFIHCYDYLLAADPGVTPFGEKADRSHACARLFEQKSAELRQLADFVATCTVGPAHMQANGVSVHEFRQGAKLFRARLNTKGETVEGLPPHGFALEEVKEARLRAVQLDLARQMETTTFVSNYIDKVSAFGINTIQLYLEARASTSVFSMPASEGYSKEALKGFVDHAAEKGVTVIPVVSLLGHAELFFRGDPALAPLSEEANGRSRWGSTQKSTFCLSNPATRDFLERHVAELCEIFKGPYFHVGFDESFNMGFCERCQPRFKPDGGDALFAEFVNWAHGVCKRNGKRMVMWDDFFGFHLSALEKVSNDILLEHWNYTANISSRGARFNFGGHSRTDWLDLYAKLGFETLTVNWYDVENVRTLADYARRYPTKGFVFGQWEDFQRHFHGAGPVRVLARVLMDLEPSRWQAEDAFVEAARRLFPSLTPAEVLAVAEIVESSPPRGPQGSVTARNGCRRGVQALADEVAIEVLKKSALKPSEGPVDDDPLCERAMLDDLILQGEAGLADELMARCAPLATDPRRTAEDIRAIKAALSAKRARLVAVVERRREQARKWRPGCGRDQTATIVANVIGGIDQALRLPETPAPKNEKRLDLCLTLVDYYGRPNWTISGRFTDGWRQIAKGGWKPARGEWAAFSKYITFTADEMPTEVKIGYDGYGAASLRYLQIEDRESIVRPAKVVSSEGAVTGAENLLADDTREAVFGVADAVGQVRDTSSVPPKASVVLSLRP